MPSVTHDLPTFPIELDGKPYYIDIGSWKARDVTDFAPKTTVPGTGAMYSDLQLYQPIAQRDFRRGFGFIWHDDESGYLNTDGYIDTRHKGAVMMSTASTSSETNNATKEGGLTYSSSYFSWGSDGVRKYASGSWSAINIQRPIWDAASEGSATGVATAGTLTVSHTVTTEGTNRALYVGVIIDTNANLTSIGVKYNTVAMSSIYSGGTTPYLEVFRLVAPATGANDIVATFTLASGTVEAVLIGASYINVLQATPEDATTAGTGTGTASAVTPTASDRENVLDFLATNGNEATLAHVITDISIQTLIAVDDTTTGTDIALATSSQFADSANSTPSMSWTWTGSQDFVHVGIPINPQAEIQVDFMLENGEYLFACPSNGRIMRSLGGSADYLPAGINNASSDYSWLEIHSGYTFAGKNSEAEIYFDGNSDLSVLAGDPIYDTDEQVAGPGQIGTKFGVSFLERLAVARIDGLWMLEGPELFLKSDDTFTERWKTRQILNFSEQKHVNNFRSMVTWGGSLYFSIQDKLLYEWNGSRLQNMTPGRITDAWEYTNYYRFDNLTPFGNWLLFSARTSSTTYDESIIAYDGVGFHKLADPITSSTTDSISMIGIDTNNNYIWFHTTGNADETFYIEYQTSSDLPFANFPTAASPVNQLTTSRIHGGFRRITKSMPFLWTEVDNVSSARYITVQYAINGSSTYHKWADLTSTGVRILALPQNLLTVEFDYINLRFIFTTDSATQTPVLENFAMMVMMRPDEKYGYTFDVIGGSAMSAGMHEDTRTGYSVMHDIRKARASKSPVLLITPFRDKIWGYVSSISENAIEWEPDNMTGGAINILQIIRINFVEVVSIEGEDVMPNF